MFDGRKLIAVVETQKRRGMPMMHGSADTVSGSRWTSREAQILAAALLLLQKHGYDGLTVDAVATWSKSSKATIYRRWPTKKALVLAAFIEGTRTEVVMPPTGSLRGDLVALGTMLCEQTRVHASTIRAVMTEVSRCPELNAAIQEEFVHQRRLLLAKVCAEAALRGEIDAAPNNDELWDLLPGYLVFRALISGRPPNAHTVSMLVDDILLPSLTRHRGPSTA